jgi:hypothetical protein
MMRRHNVERPRLTPWPFSCALCSQLEDELGSELQLPVGGGSRGELTGGA